VKKNFGLLLLFLGISGMPSLTIGQERVVNGIVINSFTKNGVENVNVFEPRFGNFDKTDSAGHFKIEFPKKSRKLLFTKSDFYSLNYRCQPGIHRRDLIVVKLKPLNFKEIDTIRKSYKNILTLSINEFLTGAVALSYERFIGKKQSVGLHTSVYLYGFNNLLLDLGSDPVSYKGIKLAPFYRFYMVRSNNHGFFIEGKIPFGYFNFSSLTYWYHGDSNSKNFPQNFWTIGGTLAAGWMFRLGHSHHGVGNVSLGCQFFPMDVPTDINLEQGAPGRLVTYSLNKAWWYATGPGSVVEIKFALGGIF